MALAGLALTGVLPTHGGEPALRRIGKSRLHSQEGRSHGASWRVVAEFGRGDLSLPPPFGETPPPLPVLQEQRFCTTFSRKRRLLSRDWRAISKSMDDDSVYASITKANYSLFT